MSSTQDLCDGIATLQAAMADHQHALDTGRDLEPSWQQVCRAIGYMTTAVAWKEDMSPAEVVGAGNSAGTLEPRWDPRSGVDNS